MNDNNNNTPKTVLITGGSSGLGYACARTLLQSPSRWQVAITSPSRERVERAAQRLVEQTGVDRVRPLTLNLDSQRAIRRFVERWAQQQLPPLHAIVTNAGIQLPRLGPVTEEGVEKIFGVNHLGHFLLCHLLLPRLAAPGRIIVVSSAIHDPEKPGAVRVPAYPGAEALARAPGDEAIRQGAKAAMAAYASSKLCNVLFAYELDRQLRAAGVNTPAAPITVNCFDPGLMPRTGLGRSHGPWVRWLWERVIPLFQWLLPGVNTPALSGARLARLVDDPGLAGTSGNYFVGANVRRSSRDSYREDYAADLWRSSLRLTGLDPAQALRAH